MKLVKVAKSIHVAATGVTYKKGQEVEISEELFARHEKRGHFKLVTDAKPKPAKPAKQPEVSAPESAASSETK